MDSLTSVAVRMYNTGFGDCFLLTFRYGPDGDGQRAKTLWIDFGVRSGKPDLMQDIAQDVHDYVSNLSPTGDALVDVLAITHEHLDHISGLKQAEKELEQITFGQVWFAWTEDPHEKLAQEWRRQKKQARKAIQTALTYLNSQGLNLNARATDLKKHLEQLAEIEAGAEPLTEGSENDAEPLNEEFYLHRSYSQLVARGQPVCYLSPGYVDGEQVYQGDVIGKGLQRTLLATVFEGARIYVLGPPKNLDVIKVGGPKQWERTLRVADQQSLFDFNASHFPGVATGENQDFWYYVRKSPFDERYVIPTDFQSGDLPSSVTKPVRQNLESPAPESIVVKSKFDMLKHTDAYNQYFSSPSEAWRRINDDYINESGNLAIRLNSGMNNTSLVLAIEIEATGEVLFFPGDAEYGVWNDWDQDKDKPVAQRLYSWTLGKDEQKPVTVEDLLSRTIFYKMGHHGSENATPKSKGLAKLSHQALHCMIPVDEATAQRYHWDKIPFQNLLSILNERKVSYIRADKSHLLTGDGSLAQANERKAASSLSERVTWRAESYEKDGTDKSLFTEWKLTVP